MKTEAERVFTIGATGAIIVAAMGLLGYVPGLVALGSIRENYIPMAPSNSLSFILLGLVLLSINFNHASRVKAIILSVITLLVFMYRIS